MIQFAYQLLVRLLAPFVFVLFLWRGLRDRGYWHGLHERLGLGQRLERPSIWVHAVSVGEVQAATSLLKALAARYPATPLLLTTGTPTGRARARANLGDSVVLRYLPYDSPGAVARFFDRVRPKVAIIIEKELWPNLYRECGLRKVPLVLASAAVSPRSVGRYRRLVVLFRETLSHGLVLAAQSAEDAARFIEIGAPPARTHVVGNIKFDAVLPPDARQQGQSWRSHYHAESCFILVAGSTYEPEERALLQVSKTLQAAGVEHLLVIAPRHPPRFEAVAQRLQSAGVDFLRHSQAKAGEVRGRPRVVLLDTLGELAGFYAAADTAFVGGSLLEGVGGHNALEPAALAVPVLMGPHVFNTQEMVDALVAEGALQQVSSTEALSQAVLELAQNATQRQARGQAALAVVERNRGTVARLMRLIEPMI